MTEDLSADELEDWILDVASSELRDIERKEISAFFAEELSERPLDAELWYLHGYALYHLWKPLDAKTSIDALESLSRALDLASEYDFARIYRIYVTFEGHQYLSCVADCHLLDRSRLIGKSAEWRLASVDEIEFASLVELSIHDERLTTLFWQIVAWCEQEKTAPWPFIPRVFLSNVWNALDLDLIHDLDERSAVLAVREIEAGLPVTIDASIE